MKESRRQIPLNLQQTEEPVYKAVHFHKKKPICPAPQKSKKSQFLWNFRRDTPLAPGHTFDQRLRQPLQLLGNDACCAPWSMFVSAPDTRSPFSIRGTPSPIAAEQKGDGPLALAANATKAPKASNFIEFYEKPAEMKSDEPIAAILNDANYRRRKADCAS